MEKFFRTKKCASSVEIYYWGWTRYKPNFSAFSGAWNAINPMELMPFPSPAPSGWKSINNAIFITTQIHLNFNPRKIFSRSNCLLPNNVVAWRVNNGAALDHNLYMNLNNILTSCFCRWKQLPILLEARKGWSWWMLLTCRMCHCLQTIKPITPLML